MTNIRAPRRGTVLTTCPFTNSAFGSPTRPGFEVRLEKTQNLVSMKLPEVIESLRASCNEVGMAMTEIAMLAIREVFGVRDKVKDYTWFGRGRLSLASAVFVTLG